MHNLNSMLEYSVYNIIKGVYTKEEGLQLPQYVPRQQNPKCY